MWPANLKSVELRGGMNLTELWMLKERMEAGHVKMLTPAEAVWQGDGRYNTLFGDESGTWCICTHGLHGSSPGGHDNWCSIIRVNKLTPEHASTLLSGWPYD